MLTRHLGDLDLAEDALQEAFAAALESGPRDGVPDNPDGWLLTVARRRATDTIRRQITHRDKLRSVALTQAQHDPDSSPPPSAVVDDRLRLVFTCCHPALALKAQVALALRHMCGLSTAQAARLFCVPVPTMAARLTRAKRKITAARIPYRIPPDAELPERVGGVLAVIYLLFTEGYASSGGPGPVRDELVDRAIEMGRLVVELLPGESEAVGLLALLLFTDARRATRVGSAGRIVLLPDQDRTRWDQQRITEGLGLLREALGNPCLYTVQAAIASEHVAAASAQDTDWAAIVRWYDVLLGIAPTPVVAMNRAVALAMRDGPASGLALLDALGEEPSLRANHLLAGARAQLLRRLAREPEAAVAFQQAHALARTDAERAFYAAQLGAGEAPAPTYAPGCSSSSASTPPSPS